MTPDGDVLKSALSTHEAMLPDGQATFSFPRRFSIAACPIISN